MMSRLLVALALTASSWSAHGRDPASIAEDGSYPFRLSAGGLINRADASLTSTRDGLEPFSPTLDNLGMDDRATVFWSEASWQFAERWQLNFSWNSFSGDGLREGVEAGNYGDLEWEIGASLDSNFDVDLLIANITWNFYQTDTATLGLGLGVHTASLDFGLTTTVDVIIDGEQTEDVIDTADEDVLAPLPNLALTGAWALSDQLFLRAYAGVLSLSIDRYDGTLFSGRAALEWYPFERIGFGTAFQYLDVDLDIDRSDRDDRYELEFLGPSLYASVRF